MGLTTFSIADVMLSFESRDRLRSIFNTDVFGDHTFLIATGISVGVIFFATTLGALQSFLQTVPLDLNQWLICIVAAAAVIVASEIRKIVLRRRAGVDDAALVAAA
jgi:Ca2+-transporting ATPase